MPKHEPARAAERGGAAVVRDERVVALAERAQARIADEERRDRRLAIGVGIGCALFALCALALVILPFALWALR